jgi:hypothetical protein
VTSIGAFAFSQCLFLTSITIPKGVTLIDDSAFKGCALLGVIKFEGEAPTIGINVFSNVANNAVAKVEKEFLSSFPPMDGDFQIPWKWNGLTILCVSNHI